MIGKDQVRAVAEEQAAADFDAGLAQIFEFGDQRGGIDHRAGTDDRFFRRAQNSAGNQLQDEAVPIEDDGVARVVAAGVTRGVIKGRGEVIDDLAFAFVAPLGADNRNRFRSSFVRQLRRSATTQVAPCPLRVSQETLQEG